MSSINAFINGEYLNSEEAKVSIDDRGFLFGDGVYEVIRFYNSGLFKTEEHLKRLNNSLASLEISSPYSLEEIEDIGAKLVFKSGLKEGILYLQITRGKALRTHAFPPSLSPTVMMRINGLDLDSVRERQKGIRIITFPDKRWGYCHIKSLNLLANVMAKEAAQRQGAYEAVFVHDLGITECCTSNIFVVKEGKLITAPEGERILSGVTRHVVKQLAYEGGIPVEYRYPQKGEMMEADEVFITNSVDEVTPVLAIDGQVIGGGECGPIVQKLQSMYQKLVEQYY